MRLGDWLNLLKYFRDQLSAQHDLRVSRDNWHEEEIDAMHRLVNHERTARGLSEVERSEIERADRLASGHVDYSLKFALYCAELVRGQEKA